jgi:hypothetical protein
MGIELKVSNIYSGIDCEISCGEVTKKRCKKTKSLLPALSTAGD